MQEGQTRPASLGGWASATHLGGQQFPHAKPAQDHNVATSGRILMIFGLGEGSFQSRVDYRNRAASTWRVKRDIAPAERHWSPLRHLTTYPLGISNRWLPVDPSPYLAAPPADLANCAAVGIKW